MKKITIVFLAACVVLAVGCHWVGIHGNGHIKTDERPVSAFANIDVRGAFTIEWQSGTPSLRITTDENLLAHPRTDSTDPRNPGGYLEPNAGRSQDQWRSKA